MGFLGVLEWAGGLGVGGGWRVGRGAWGERAGVVLGGLGVYGRWCGSGGVGSVGGVGCRYGGWAFGFRVLGWVCQVGLEGCLEVSAGELIPQRSL